MEFLFYSILLTLYSASTEGSCATMKASTLYHERTYRYVSIATPQFLNWVV